MSNTYETLSRSKKTPLIGAFWGLDNRIVKGLFNMVQSLHGRLTTLYRRLDLTDGDRSWFIRETDSGDHYIITYAIQGTPGVKRVDYHMDEELWSSDNLDRLLRRISPLKEGITHEQTVDSFNRQLYPNFEDSPFYKVFGEDGVTIIENLLAVYFDVGLDYYIYFCQAVTRLIELSRRTEAIKTPYRKLQKALGSLDEPHKEDPVINNIIKLYKGKPGAVSDLRNVFEQQITGFKILHGDNYSMPTLESINQLYYYLTLWDKLLLIIEQEGN